MKISLPEDPFGIKVAVKGAVELAKDYLHPIAKAKGEARADLVRVRGAFEARKLENQLRVIELAEKGLRDQNIEPSPIHEDILYNVLEESGRTSSDELHALWAELLISSVSGSLSEFRAMTFSRILSQLSPADVRVVGQLVEVLPLIDLPLIDVVYKVEIGKDANFIASCICKYTIREEKGLMRYEDYVQIKTADESVSFIFSLRNLERLGIVSSPRIDSMILGVSILRDFVFTKIGTEFLRAVNAFEKREIVFSEPDLF